MKTLFEPAPGAPALPAASDPTNAFMTRGVPDDAASEALPEPTLLVVDDIEENRLAMRALLGRPALRILTASSGDEALELLLVHDVALALLDVQMPGIDGFQLAELMRGTERTRRVPIIFITAMSRDTPRMFRGYETGAIDFLFKPVDPRILQSKVEAFVEMDRHRRLLARRNAALMEAIELNEMLTAVLAHDLRVPLSAIMTAADIVALSAPPDHPGIGNAAERIRRASGRMARMVTDLLDFARIRAGTLSLQTRPGDLVEVMRALIDELTANRRDDRGIELRVTGDPRAEFDAERMAQVFANLLGNALEHGAGPQVHVTLNGSEPVRVEIQIVNAGELPGDARALFTPFHHRQAGRPTHGKGLGLGLFIAQQFVAAHGGSIAAESGEGRTMVTVRLPRCRSATPDV